MMRKKLYTQRSWIIAILIALVVGLGAGLRGAAVLGQTGTSSDVATKTALPPVTPVLREQEAAFALEAQFISVHKRASPAVVNITSRSYATNMFMRTVPQEGTGSGFVYDQRGHIVTNYHVVENAEKLTVTFADGEVYEAQMVGTDPINDLAVIRINAGIDLPEPLAVADSDTLQVGQFVVAIGNPFGLDQTLTTGVISALGRIIESPEDNRFIGEAIQTDAAINPGNSGGPMLDLRGRVIGVNSQIISPSGAYAGIGFAVSSNTVQRVVPELIARGYYPHPWLGVQMLALTPSSTEMLREAGMNVPVDAGLLVLRVVEDAPAEKAGLEGSTHFAQVGNTRVPVDGDILVAINDQPTHTFQELTVYLETETTAGDTVELTIFREGEELVVPVTLAELPRDG